MRFREYWDESSEPLEEYTLPAGTILYHGTSAEEEFEHEGDLEAPAWVTTSEAVARTFMTRWAGSNVRILVFELIQDYPGLATIHSKDDMEQLMDGDFDGGAEEMAEYVCYSTNYSGWYIPENYPSGDDILLCDTSSLRYKETIQP